METGDFGPFELGVFPEFKYDLIGKNGFDGLGNKSGNLQVKGKNVLMNSFFSENTINKNRLKGMKNEVFFQILDLTDTIANENDKLTDNGTKFRNPPNFLGQEFVKIKTNKIEYLAFVDANNTAYVIINTRVFDVSFGKTILNAPKKNNTLISLKIKSPQMSSVSITKNIASLIMSKF